MNIGPSVERFCGFTKCENFYVNKHTNYDDEITEFRVGGKIILTIEFSRMCTTKQSTIN